MKSCRIASCVAIAAIAVLFSHAVGSSTSLAQETGQNYLRFKKPSLAAHGSRANQANLKFRSPTDARPTAKKRSVQRTARVEPTNHANKKQTAVKRRKKVATAGSPKPRNKKTARRDAKVIAVVDEVLVAEEEVVGEMVEHEPELEIFGDMMPYDAYDSCDICTGGCTCEVSCGIGEPGCGLEGLECSCGIGEPGCGICEPDCGIYEPDCGLKEPNCGLQEPSCSLGADSCGSSVGHPGSDYWCFPVCLPRFKDFSAWGGVQGFRGPRDFSNDRVGAPRSDSNFGFHEGVNISGRAPLVSLLFPQLSYQLGYQAMQSRLSGTATSTEDRNQQFVTAGIFRRVKTGLQFGAAWDLLRDDLDKNVDYHQVRTEISIKSPQGREFGFWSATATNDNTIFGTTYETVDQYALFCRWNFGKNYECRLWGGATGKDDGIFGGEFQAPLSDRWSVLSGFNYLITDKNAGLAGVQEEAWNIGINLVWHMGRTARQGCRSPYRPLFAVANNGWMIVDDTAP